MASNKLSFLASRVVPDFVANNFPNFEVFIKSYFEYLEQDLGEYDTVANLLSYRDIDNTVDSFISKFQAETASRVPPNAAASLRLLIKNVKKFYRTKGTEDGYKFMFRAIFDSALEFYYPKVDVLRASDSTTILSDNDRIVDSNYWQDFSYVIKSEVSQGILYDKLIKDLLHPAGLKYFSELSLSVDVPTMAGLILEETLTILIYLVVLNAMQFSLITSDLTQIVGLVSQSSSLGHSTGWFVANRENEDIVRRDGLGNLSNFETLPIWMIEGRDGHALTLAFTNDTKDTMDNITAVDNTLTATSKSAGDVFTILSLPHRDGNAGQILSYDGSSTIPVEFIGTDKNKLLLFVNGSKVSPSAYSILSSNTVTFSTPPAASAVVEWYVADHTSESKTYISGTENYAVTTNISAISKRLHVFVNGKYKMKDIDYSINLSTNEILFLKPQISLSEIECILVKNVHVETHLVPTIESFVFSGGETQYTVLTPPSGTEFLTLLLNGALLKKNLDYSFTTPVITFDVNISASDLLEVFIFARQPERHNHSYVADTVQTNFYLDLYVDVYSPLVSSELAIILACFGNPNRLTALASGPISTITTIENSTINTTLTICASSYAIYEITFARQVDYLLRFSIINSTLGAGSAFRFEVVDYNTGTDAIIDTTGETISLAEGEVDGFWSDNLSDTQTTYLIVHNETAQEEDLTFGVEYFFNGG